ncbi:MAG: hypothetical protein IT510_15475 [Sulfuritalea sp.]|nr:hypothetical protein [Sulfuritalea sp.]
MQPTDLIAGTMEQKQVDHTPHLVPVKIDGRDIEIEATTYRIPDLKSRLGVPLDYELDLIKGDHFDPLADDHSYKVHGHEAFLSHVRTGSSS